MPTHCHATENDDKCQPGRHLPDDVRPAPGRAANPRAAVTISAVGTAASQATHDAASGETATPAITAVVTPSTVAGTTAIPAIKFAGIAYGVSCQN